MKTLNEDALVDLCRQLDGIECEMRQLETSLTRIRMGFREAVSSRRRVECGFVESEHDGGLLPRKARGK